MTAPRLETLEARRVPSSFGDQAAGDPTFDMPNQTYDQALNLGDVWASPGVLRHGSLGVGEAGAGDVEWYRFVLDRPARVSLRLAGSEPDSSFRGALSLFNTDLDFVDFTNPQGLRRLDLAVADTGDGVATMDRVIGPGTYNLAVSGEGNEIFSPLVAHTGLPGSTGDFELSLSAIDAGPAPSDGPWVLNSNPAPEALLTSSPLVIRVELSRPLDPATIEPGRTVQLTFSPNGTFGGAGDQAVPLAALNVSSSTGELRLVPASPLAAGYYRVVLTGNGDLGASVLAATDGTPFGSDDLHPTGQDYVFTFQVGGVEGNTNLTGPADDTPAGAHELGDLALSEPVRVEAAIGDDPFYNPANAFGRVGPFRPENDVDLYHFRVSGPGPHTFFADVFAGRLGSPLAPGLRLFRFDAETQQLDLVDTATFIYDIIPVADRGVLPQLSDATMSGNLDAGDYYLAVSSGMTWSYDPSVSHSNQESLDSGPYVLNLLLSPTSADASPYSRKPYVPPFEPDPTDSSGDDGGGFIPGSNGGLPPGHGAPPLPNPPGTGGGVSIHSPTSPGNDSPPGGGGRPPGGGTSSYRPPPGGGTSSYRPPPSGTDTAGGGTSSANPPPSGMDTAGGGMSSSNPLPSGMDTSGGGTASFTPPFQETQTAGERPPSGEISSFTPPFHDEEGAGISSSTDLSVLAFQPVGGVTRSEQEPTARPGPAASKPAAVASVSTYSSQGIALSTPTLIGLAPAPSPPIATGNVPSPFEPRIASVTPPADRSGVVPQMPVPWAPDPGQFDSRRAVAANGFGERTLEFHVLKVVHQPLASAAIATAERAMVPDGMAVETAPVPAPAYGDGLGTNPEDPGPAVTIAATLSTPEDQAEWPQTWKLGWALLAVTGLSSLAYFRYRESFKPRWLSRSPRSGVAGKRPGLGVPSGSSRGPRANPIGPTSAALSQQWSRDGLTEA